MHTGNDSSIAASISPRPVEWISPWTVHLAVCKAKCKAKCMAKYKAKCTEVEGTRQFTARNATVPQFVRKLLADGTPEVLTTRSPF